MKPLVPSFHVFLTSFCFMSKSSSCSADGGIEWYRGSAPIPGVDHFSQRPQGIARAIWSCLQLLEVSPLDIAATSVFTGCLAEKMVTHGDPWWQERRLEGMFWAYGIPVRSSVKSVKLNRHQ